MQMQTELWNTEMLMPILLLELDRPTATGMIWSSAEFEEYLESDEWLTRVNREVITIATGNSCRQEIDFATRLAIPDIAFTLRGIQVEVIEGNKYLVGYVASKMEGFTIPPFDLNTRYVIPRILALVNYDGSNRPLIRKLVDFTMSPAIKIGEELIEV